jgi:hypothetical protein
VTPLLRNKVSKLIDLTKRRFGRFIVFRRVENDKNGNLYWLCKCDCGQEKVVGGNDLKSGGTKSCGCLRRQTMHGHKKRGKITGTYISWRRMIQRCTNPNDKDYHYYGGRGITVYKRWLRFENFLKDMGERPEGYTIDRINNNKGYYKLNCRWATRSEQQKNKRKGIKC